MNAHPEIKTEDQHIDAFINQLTIPPSNSTLDMFMAHELQWIPTPGPFDSKMLADLSMDTCQTFPIDMSSCMPWSPMTTADYSMSGSMLDLNQPFLSQSSSSPLSYPSMSTPLDQSSELIIPSMSDISSVWSPNQAQLFQNPLTPPSQLSIPTFLDSSSTTVTNARSQPASYHPSPLIPASTLPPPSYMPPTLNHQAPTHFRTKRSQSVCHTKKLHICEVDNCFQTFKRAEHLKRHQRCVHFDHRPYQCPIPTCNKFFSRTDNLAAHIKIHQRRNSTLN